MPISIRNAETLFHELQALARLKEPPAPPDHARAPAADSAGSSGAVKNRAAITRAIRRMLSLFEPLELVRQVAPGQRPQPRHEWDQTRSGLPKRGIF